MSDWIAHDGKECPVAPETVVVVRRRHDEPGTKITPWRADGFPWEHTGSDIDIMFYRLADKERWK